jgi:hypothetical protein
MNRLRKWSASRWSQIRAVAGYGTVIAVTPYLLIKIAWTFGFFLPTEQMGDAGWRAINAATAVLAAAGILLALAFCAPWGERLPAWLVALPAWIGTGLLVPMLLLAPALGPAAVSRDLRTGAAGIWAYEQILIILSLVGVAVGLPLAFAGYVRSRWPEAVGGRTGHRRMPGRTGKMQTRLGRFVAAGSIVVGIARGFWAAGGTLGLEPELLAARDLWWHLLSLSASVWAFAGAWGVLVMTSRGGSRWFLPPIAAAWVSSGMLFTYSLYDLLLYTSSLRAPPEYPLAYVSSRGAGIVLGVMMGMIILLVLHDRRLALRHSPREQP